MKQHNVLVTAAGSIVSQGIIKCLKLANKQKSGTTYRIFSTDMSAMAPGLYRTDAGIIVPAATSKGYLRAITRICNSKKIDAIFIGSDEELVPLTHSKNRIENATGATVITNPASVVSTAVDKWRTFEFLSQNGLPCADSALPQDQESFIRKHGFPLVVKPREGHGSLHFYLVRNARELENASVAIRNAGWRPLLQEYLRGADSEFTTGITTDQYGRVMSSISMKKHLKNGQTYKAFIDSYDEVRKSAETAAERIGARGSINIQAKVSDGKPKIFEINARFSATVPLRAVAGVNEPDIVFRNTVLNEKIRIKKYRQLVCMRYWNEVYVPYSTYKRAERLKKTDHSDAFIADYF